MEKLRPFILLGIAVIIAFITSVLIYNWLQKKAQVKAHVPLETQAIAVAATNLSWGTVLKSEMIKTVPFLKGSLPEGYFSDPASLTGRVLISPLKANEPIFESKLAPTSIKTGGVAAVITPKKRAIAIRVDKTIGVSGFINPGNRVDVLVTLSAEQGQTPMTKTVLENILVLAAGPETEIKGKEKPSEVDVITLEVTPEEAEKVGLAATQGKILLTLRNFNDNEDVTTRGMTIPTLVSSYSYAPARETMVVRRQASAGKRTEITPIAVERAQKKPRVSIVELIQGSKSSEVKFEE